MSSASDVKYLCQLYHIRRQTKLMYDVFYFKYIYIFFKKLVFAIACSLSVKKNNSVKLNLLTSATISRNKRSYNYYQNEKKRRKKTFPELPGLDVPVQHIYKNISEFPSNFRIQFLLITQFLIRNHFLKEI